MGRLLNQFFQTKFEDGIACLIHHNLSFDLFTGNGHNRNILKILCSNQSKLKNL